jgi:prolyl oligopeptidase
MSPAPAAPPARTLPVPTRQDDVVDDYFGTKVRDPYQWLEASDSPEVDAWTDAQNALTRHTLDAIGGRDALHEKIHALLALGVVAGPAVRTVKPGLRRYFHTRREGEQDQPVLYVRDGVDGKDRVLIDPSALSADVTTALDWWYPSQDGTLLAWGRSDSGSEDSTLYVRDVSTDKDLADRIPFTRHASVAWTPDRKRFFYTRFPEPGSVPAGDEKYYCKVFEHVLGADAKTDRVVFGEGRAKTDGPSVMISPDGRWLVVRVHIAYGHSEVYLRDLSLGERGKWVDVAVSTDAIFDPTPRNDRLYVQTNDGASRGRLFAVEYAHPERARWKEIIAESEDVLGDTNVIGHTIVATYMHDAASRLERFGLDGKSLGPIDLPSLGSAVVSGAWDGDEAFVQFASYVVPPEVSRFDLRTQKMTPWDKVGASFTPPKVSVSRLYATSKDGTRIPMFVVEKEGAVRDGTSAAVLWGYGGFNLSYTPGFSASALLTATRGGVWVMTTLRGGGEYGEAWHRAGMLDKKQHVFDDFLACAEALVAQKVASPERLGAIGGSNGGLLVAAVVTQRPELFRVGLSLVPLADMLRYQRFRIAKFWVTEYGSSEDPEQFKVLEAYSPYHHVQDGTRYPALLFTTAESDSRVDPMHARKMAARMQAAQSDPKRPVLLRVEKKAGHGQGKPVSKLVDELTDELSFLFCELGLRP